MKRITLGLIISGLLAPGCEDALAPGQGDINQQPELRRAARRSRDASCGEADAGSSVDALVYVDSGSDSNRRAYNLDAGHDNDASSYDLPGAEVPPESSRLICERASFSLNRISINDGITSINHLDSEGNVLYTTSINWAETSSVGGIGGGDKETCFLTFEVPQRYSVFTVPPDFCRCIEGTEPEAPCPISPDHPDQLQCGSGIIH